MRKRVTLCLVFILFVLTSCQSTSDQANSTSKIETTDQSEEPSSSQESYKLSYKGQTFHIIYLDQAVLEFANLVKGDSSLDREKIYNEKVINTFQELASENEVKIGTGYFDYFSSRTNIGKLKENAIKVSEQKEQINEAVKEALHKSVNRLSGGDKTLFIKPMNPDEYDAIYKMEGVAGVAFSEDAILLQIDPSYKEDMLTYTVAHEYLHTVEREKNKGEKYSVLDLIVGEGKADAFAHMVYPDKQVAWAKPLSEPSQKKAFDQLRSYIHSYDYHVYAAFVNGNPQKGIPRWTSYKLGGKITQSYLDKHHDESVDEWVNHKGKEFLQGSAYRDLLH